MFSKGTSNPGLGALRVLKELHRKLLPQVLCKVLSAALLLSEQPTIRNQRRGVTILSSVRCLHVATLYHHHCATVYWKLMTSGYHMPLWQAGSLMPKVNSSRQHFLGDMPLSTAWRATRGILWLATFGKHSTCHPPKPLRRVKVCNYISEVLRSTMVRLILNFHQRTFLSWHILTNIL